MVDIKYINVVKTARYLLKTEDNNNQLFIALHGYGYSINTFYHFFEGLEKNGFDILIPEAIHRFYTKGTSGTVGNSWMTKEMRNFEIKENCEYLENLLKEIATLKNYTSIYLLGFSQGGNTAIRWITKSKFTFCKLLIWASSIPNEVQQNEILNLNTKKYFIIGDKDEFISTKEQIELKSLYTKLGFKLIEYNGNHKINTDILFKSLSL